MSRKLVTRAYGKWSVLSQMICLTDGWSSHRLLAKRNSRALLRGLCANPCCSLTQEFFPNIQCSGEVYTQTVTLFKAPTFYTQKITFYFDSIIIMVFFFSEHVYLSLKLCKMNVEFSLVVRKILNVTLLDVLFLSANSVSDGADYL